MNNKRISILAVTALASLLACNNEVEDQTLIADFQEMGISVTAPSVAGLPFAWEPGDALSIFDGKANQEFVTEESGTTAVFTGTANAKAPAFLVSEDNGVTWKNAGPGSRTGDSKYSEAGVLQKDGYTYMIGTRAGRD